MSQKVNQFQAKMKEVTRQMMATVSELSMYQATSMKLEEESALLRDAAAEGRARIAAQLPPTDDAEREFLKNLRFEQQRAADMLEASNRREEEEILLSNA